MRQAIALLCLLLLSALSMAQVTHDHANDAKAAQHCSVCFAAHSAVAKSSAVSAPLVLASTRKVIALRECLTSLLLTENLYIRPPPAA